MQIAFKIAERKGSKKSKYVAALTTVEVKLKGNSEMVFEIYDIINDKIIKENRIVY